MFESGILEETEAAEQQYGIGKTAAQLPDIKSLLHSSGGKLQSKRLS